MRTPSVSAALAVAVLLGSAVQSAPTLAQDAIEEIIVTARQREETLQDVPVTVAAFSEAELDRYNLNTLTQVAKMVPNMQIAHGGSGNGSNLYLRGVGSSSISAAFDQSVALNIDGVVVNRGRMIHHAYLDMKRIEILKGPQSLYFGKSATAGVVSILSNNPIQEFELEGMVAYESEYDQTYSEFIISGPVTETLGARLAVGTTDSDELFENLSPDVKNGYRGEESTDARLTLLWEPSDFFTANFKLSYQDYQNDGANGRTEQLCAEDEVQNTAIPIGGIGPNSSDDCDFNGNTAVADLNPLLAGQLPAAKGGVPYLEQTTYLPSLTLTLDISDTLTATSVTAYTDLKHEELDNYGYADNGIFGGYHENSYEAWSQELRISSDFDGALNFMGGLYYQTIDQSFEAYQYAVNIGLVAPDPATGNTYDYNKNHFLDTDVWSAFGAVYWDVTETIEVTAGVRYTDEEKDGYITIPYVHTFLQGTFSSPPVIDGLEFDDDNWSPEVAVNWYVTPDISLFAAYKQGFKSGGVDNSALPSAALDPSNPDFPDFLIYESEDAKGGEAGMKANLLDGSMSLNATAFYYIYEDLQVQLFDAVAIQFSTFNASELTVYGAEADSVWFAPFMEGLQFRGALAYTDAEYTDDFFNAQGQNLDGEDRERNADLAGYAGVSYDRELGGNWAVELSADARYSDEYTLAAELNADVQDSFWLYDAAVRVYSQDGRYEVSLIGRNIGDEIYAYSNGPRPGACANEVAGVCTGGRQDQTTTTSLGQTYTLQLRVRL